MLGNVTHISDKSDVGRVCPLPNKKGTYVTAYNASGGTLAIGQPALLSNAYTAGREVSALAPATKNFPVWVGIVIEAAVAAAAIGKFQITGEVEALVSDTSSLSAGRGLEVLNAGTSLVDDGDTVVLTTTAAFLRDAVTAAENGGTPILKTVVLNGMQHTIAGS
jgi:hypothetical protein